MVVRKLLEQNPTKKIWLCPHEHSSTSIAPVKWECGLVYEIAAKIPSEILESKIMKTWIEKDGEFADYRCIIWYNWRCDESKVDKEE